MNCLIHFPAIQIDYHIKKESFFVNILKEKYLNIMIYV